MYSLSEGGQEAKEARAVAENRIDWPNVGISSIKIKIDGKIIEISNLIDKFKKRAQLQKEIEVEVENLLDQTKTI